jgi:hypothetical protein
MAHEYRSATEAENVEFKAYARHFEHRDENEEERRRAVIYAVGTMSFPDSGWQVDLVQVEGHVDEWILLEDPPGYGDKQRTYVIASGTSLHEVEEVPKTIVVRYGEDGNETTRVSVVPWD